MTYVASVAGHGIPLSRVDERLRRIRRGPFARHLPPEGAADSIRLRRGIVQELVKEQVLIHELNVLRDERGKRRSPERRFTRPEMRGLFAAVTADVTVAEGDLRAYYDRNVDLYRRPERRVVRHRLVDAGRRAAAPPAESASGGELLTLRRGEFAGAFEDAVFDARPGEVVGPVRSELGWHVARLERIEPAEMLPYAEVRSSIEVELLATARATAFAQWLETRTKALAVIEPAYEHPGHPIHGHVTHRH